MLYSAFLWRNAGGGGGVGGLEFKTYWYFKYHMVLRDILNLLPGYRKIYF